MARQMKDSGIEWIGEIPETWNTDRLQWHLEEVNVSNSPVQSENVLSLTIEAGVIPYEEKGNQGNKSKENYEEYKLAYPDTLVVNSMNVIIGAVGISKYFGCVSPVYYVFKAAEGTDLRYIYYLFTNVGFQKEMRKHAKGILEIRLRISSGDMLKLSIPNPTYEEQHRIAAFLDRKCAEIDAVIERTKATIEEYKKLKQAVITEAVTKGVRGASKMKDSGIEWIGEIPEEWEVTPLKYLITGYKAGPFGSALITDKLNPEGNILVYTPEHVAKKTAELEFNLYLPDERQEEMQQFIVTPGDIIFPIVGSLGRSMLVTDDMPMGIINQRLAKFRLSSHELSIDYFMWLFSKGSFYNTYIDLNCRGSIIVNLTKQIVNDMPVPHPVSLEEQDEIVAYLDEKCAALDTLIAKKTALLTELETYKKSLIYEYVTGKKEVGA